MISLPLSSPPGESSVFSVPLISGKTLAFSSDRFPLKRPWLAPCFSPSSVSAPKVKCYQFLTVAKTPEGRPSTFLHGKSNLKTLRGLSDCACDHWLVQPSGERLWATNQTNSERITAQLLQLCLTHLDELWKYKSPEPQPRRC